MARLLKTACRKLSESCKGYRISEVIMIKRKLLVFGMVLLLFAGCGKGGSGEDYTGAEENGGARYAGAYDDDYDDDDYADDDYDDYTGYDDGYAGYDGADYDDGYAGYDDYDDYGQAGAYASSGSISKFGSSGRLEGTIAVVTILVNGTNGSWDFEKQQDIDTYGYLYNGLKIGSQWISKVCRNYGRKVSFVWDWEQHEELLYSTSVSASVAVDEEAPYTELCSFIRKNIDSEGVKKSLGANGIIYLACMNTPSSNKVTSYTYMWEREYPRQEEICLMLMNCEGEIEAPSHFAHEMLHTFGAPDLYSEGMYGITQEYVDYVTAERTNDIMYNNSDPNTGEYVYDRVPNEMTDITAYYLGLTDYSETVQQWGFAASDYDSR